MKAVEFAISMKDKASSVIDKIGKEFSTAKAKADSLGTSVDTVNSKVGKIGGKLKEAFMQVPGASFLTNPYVLAGAGIAAISKLGMENEKATVSFEVLLQSSSKAKDMLGQINKYADKTPYEKMGLRDAAKMMLGFGISQDKIMPNLKMIGDIAMGDAGKMSQLTLAFSQMSSAGKLQGQDLLQMINAGFNPLGEMTKYTGKSMAELRKEMEKGGISADMVEKAFQHATSAGGIFNGMTDRMGQTAGGKMSTLIDTAKNRLLDMYGVIQPLLIPAIDFLTGALDFLGKPIGWLITAVSWFFNKLSEGNPIIWALVGGIAAFTIGANAAAIASNVVGVATKVWAGAQKILNFVMEANPIVKVVAIVFALGVAVTMAYQKIGWFRGAVQATWEIVKGFGNMIKDYVIDRITGIISGLGGLAKSIMLLFKGDFKEAWKTAKQAGADLIGIEASRNALANARQMGKDASTAYYKGVAEVSKSKGAKNIPGTNVPIVPTKPGPLPQIIPTANGNSGSSSGGDGGTRTSQISITVKNLVESIHFNGDFAENKMNLVERVKEALTEVLLVASQTAS